MIGIAREGRKPDVIRNALREYLSTSHKVHARAG